MALLIGAEARAQVDVGVSGWGLVSIQPIDGSYVGSPYLSEGIGGIGPGFGGGLSVIMPNGFVVAGEYSTARFEQVQDGRLVLGPFPLEHVPATTRLRDSLASVLAGYARGGATRLVFLGGVSFRLDRATINDVEAEDYRVYGTGEKVLPALTAGVDFLSPLSPRVSLSIGGRYTFNQRDERLEYLGIGSHIIRGTAGIRIKLN